MNAESNEKSLNSAIVIDQSELFRLGVEKVLSDVDFLVKGGFSRAADGLWLSRSNPSELVIVASAPDLKPKSALKALKTQKSAPKVVFLVDRVAQGDVARYIAFGVDALLVRTATAAELADAIRGVMDDRRVIAPALAAGTIGRIGPSNENTAADAGLSPREFDVLGELAAGSTYAEIAAALIVSKATVKTHLIHIYEKLEVKNRNEAVAKGLALGLLG